MKLELLVVTAKSSETPGGCNPWLGENLKVEEKVGQKEQMFYRGNCHVFKVILWVGSSRVGAIKSEKRNN